MAVALGGIGIAGLSVLRESRRAHETPPTPSAVSVPEAPIVQRVLEERVPSLPNDRFGLGHRERALRLKLNGTPERTIEVAAELYAIAEKHLALSDFPEATRVAQECADMAPATLLAARCWALCGDASAGTQPQLPLSTRYWERANRFLDSRLQQSPDDKESLSLKAQILLKLGLAEARFQRFDTAAQHLRELIADGPLSPYVEGTARLRAQLALSNLLSLPVATEESEKLRQAAWDLALSDAIPPAEALRELRNSLPATLREESTRFAPTPAPMIQSPTRLESLQTLWNTPRFQGLTDWYSVGDELTSEYYFHQPRQLADFEIVSRLLLAELPKTITALSPESSDRENLESILATNLLLATSTAQERGDQSEVVRLTEKFESTFQGRDVRFIAPLDRPAQRMHRIGEIYRTTMLGHVEQMKQRQASPRVPEPR